MILPRPRTTPRPVIPSWSWVEGAWGPFGGEERHGELLLVLLVLRRVGMPPDEVRGRTTSSPRYRRYRGCSGEIRCDLRDCRALCRSAARSELESPPEAPHSVGKKARRGDGRCGLDGEERRGRNDDPNPIGWSRRSPR